jgi:hypothetical protein
MEERQIVAVPAAAIQTYGNDGQVYLTLSQTALLPPPYPMALGLIGHSKKPVLMPSARSDQS